MYATFGNHLASFTKLECAWNETLVDVTRQLGNVAQHTS